MTIHEFKALHKYLRIQIKKQVEYNTIPSDTDPTQDIPIRNINLAANGLPINVKDLSAKMPFSNIKVENLTSIDRRNNDTFDVLGELQGAANTASRSGIETNYKPIKKHLKHED